MRGASFPCTQHIIIFQFSGLMKMENIYERLMNSRSLCCLRMKRFLEGPIKIRTDSNNCWHICVSERQKPTNYSKRIRIKRAWLKSEKTSCRFRDKQRPSFNVSGRKSRTKNNFQCIANTALQQFKLTRNTIGI